MSIYSGFANRQLEANYNRLIEGTLRILQGRLLKFYEEIAEEDKNFIKLLSKNVSYLAIMERNKYLPPKLSECLRDICTFLNIEIPSNEQQAANSNLHSSQQGSLQRNNSFTRQSNNNSPTQLQQSHQQNQYKRTFSPIFNDNSNLKRSFSPGQMRSSSPRGNNQQYMNSKKSLSPIPQGNTNNSHQQSSKRMQNNNQRTNSPRGGNQTQNRIYNNNQNSYATLSKDNSRERIQYSSIQQQNGNYYTSQQQQQYSKINPKYLYNHNQKKQQQMPLLNRQQNNRSQSPKGAGYIQGYSDINNSYQNNNNNNLSSNNNHRTKSPRNASSSFHSSSNQQRLPFNSSQKNNTVSEGSNPQFYDYHINERKNSSVQGRNFRMKTLNNSPSSQDYNYNQNQNNPITKRHNSSQIQKELSSNFGLTKKTGNMQKKNSYTNSQTHNSERNNNYDGAQSYNYNPNIQNQQPSRNQNYLTKQKIKQGLESNQNDYTLVDETIMQMKRQINIYCKQNKPEPNPFEISPLKSTITQGDNTNSSKILLQQLSQQDTILDNNSQIVIETRSYSIAKKPLQPLENAIIQS